ncbi:UPF0687 protein C20orf27 homolog [Amblyraja radiata]|uniref:UPF0687 protein C20orf27 homolog n=1 Tax=Amblyraja radiata TaxID=386614 RepID=UPI001402D617|nr:UPF0687 protein C20orf27 homolog [Amblyraja radiata]
MTQLTGLPRLRWRGWFQSCKGTKPKVRGVRFRPESHEGPANHVHFEEKLHDSIVMVTQEEDGSFLVKVGFLKISHKYEIMFLLPTSQNLGQGSCCTPLPSLYLKLVEITPVPEGKVRLQVRAQR